MEERGGEDARPPGPTGGHSLAETAIWTRSVGLMTYRSRGKGRWARKQAAARASSSDPPPCIACLAAFAPFGRNASILPGWWCLVSILSGFVDLLVVSANYCYNYCTRFTHGRDVVRTNAGIRAILGFFSKASRVPPGSRRVNLGAGSTLFVAWGRTRLRK